MKGLFEAAKTSAHFSDVYLRKFFSGDKPLTDAQKKHFSDENNLTSIADFFEDNIDEALAGNIIEDLGVPETGVPNVHALSVALAFQMNAIGNAENDEADDVLAMEYQRCCEQSEDESASFHEPLYRGDAIFVADNPSHEVISTEIFQHTWELINTGTQPWHNRKLVYMRDPNVDRPEANPPVIEIDDVKPGERIKITTTFDSRGFDGNFNCCWEMQDENGKNCFPERKLLFCVRIDAKFKRK